MAGNRKKSATNAAPDLLDYLIRNRERVVSKDDLINAGPAGAATADYPIEPPRPALRLLDKPSIAVLPFTNLSSDPDQDYFADGMVDEITTALSRFKTLFVIARNSSFTYKSKVVDIK